MHSKKPSYQVALMKSIKKKKGNYQQRRRRNQRRRKRKKKALSPLVNEFFSSNYEGPLVKIMLFLGNKMLYRFIGVNKNVYRIFRTRYFESIEFQRMIMLNNESANVRNSSISCDFFKHQPKESSDHLIDSREEFEKNLCLFLRNEEKMIDVVKSILRDNGGLFYIGGSACTYSCQKDADPEHTKYLEEKKKEKEENDNNNNNNNNNVIKEEKKEFKKVEEEEEGESDTDSDVMIMMGFPEEVEEEVKSTYGDSDLDIFLIYDPDNEDEDEKRDKNVVLRNMLSKVKKIIDYKYVIVNYNDVINIIPEDTKRFRTIQIILRDIRSVDEFLSFVDLDCTRILFNGEDVITSRDGMRSFCFKTNIMSRYSSNTDYILRRMAKYKVRGFEVLDGKFHHPLTHLIEKRDTKRQYEREVRNVSSFVYTNALGGLGPRRGRGRGRGRTRRGRIFRDRIDTSNKSWFLKSVGNMFRRGRRNGRSIRYGDRNTNMNESRFNYEIAFYDSSKMKYEEAMDVLKVGKNQTNLNTFNLEGKEIRIFGKIDEFLHLDQSNKFFRNHNPFDLMRKFSVRECYMCSKYQQYRTTGECISHSLCPKCFDLNTMEKKRSKKLNGKIAIVTGCRIKIGYEVCLRLLRNGCTVIGTTRFIKDAKKRFLKERDFKIWKNKLFLYPLDLKKGELVIEFINEIKNNFKRIHILINNAAVTIRRPIQYYSELIKNELRNDDPISMKEFVKYSFSNNNNKNKNKNKNNKNRNKNIKLSKKSMSLVPYFETKNHIVKYNEKIKRTMNSVMENMNSEDHLTKGNLALFPKNKKDEYGEQIDLRKKNSWNVTIDQINPIELLEVQAVNHISPTMLVSGLFSLMIPRIIDLKKRDNSYIINVTSDEGYFDPKRYKTDFHPHTNISKAALNMLTRTSANYFAKYGVIMNSVDTGWITSDRIVKMPVQGNFKPPLKLEDGAARILSPILKETKEYGKLFRNYVPVEW